MSQTKPEYTPTKRSKLKRLHERGSYVRDDVYAILDAGLICHIAYVIDGQPYVTPTAYWRHKNRVYWHGSAASRMLEAQANGLAVCLTVTHLDGLVMARSGFHHSVNFRSVMLFGTAKAVTDPEEKVHALDEFIDRIAPGRRAELRPNEAQELKATLVVAMEIDEASAKVRAKPPVDDEPDYALPVWAGVIPVAQVIGTPEPDPRLTPGIGYPKHLAPFKAGARFDDILKKNRLPD